MLTAVNVMDTADGGRLSPTRPTGPAALPASWRD